MKRTYVQPALAVAGMEASCPLLAGSGNSLAGKIVKTGEKIETGDENDEGGTEASSKADLFGNLFSD